MHYTIRHVTRFTYEAPITESMMEARMQPRSDGKQRCLQFGLSTNPSSRVMMYQDHDGNLVHHFNIPGRHARLTVTAEALVECAPFPALPDRLGVNAWPQLDALTGSGEHWEMLNPSSFAKPSAALNELARQMNINRSQDPMTLLRGISTDIFNRFAYSQKITRVDSPIDDALQAGSGVCQDFTHMMIALARAIGIPCRYVSGYLFHHANSPDRSRDGATHAWAEAFLPELGWVGFDPTNNLIAGDRHIRVAVGRDYADVPPTRGVFKGKSAVRSELAVAVSVGPATSQIAGESMPFIPWMSREANGIITESANASQNFQQQQRQQQQ
jgi:transglutaminase-like putative cysteine protease